MKRTIEIEVTENKMLMLDALCNEIPFLYKGRWYRTYDEKFYSLCPNALDEEDYRCSNIGFFFLDATEQFEENDVDPDLDEVIVLKDENGNYWVDWEMVTEYWETDDPENWDMEKDPEEIDEADLPEWFKNIDQAIDQMFGFLK